MSEIIIHRKIGCGFSEKAIQLLNTLNLYYSIIDYNPNDPNYNLRKENLFNITHFNTFPQIIINGRLIGGYSDLVKFYSVKQ